MSKILIPSSSIMTSSSPSSYRKSKMMWYKFKSCFSKQDEKHGDNQEESLVSKSNVNEQYMQVLRTNSYIQIHSKLQARLLRKSLDRLSSSSSSLPPLNRRQDYLHESCSEILTNNEGMSEIPPFLKGFFRISFEGCQFCELILKNIQRTRANCIPMRRVLKKLERMSSYEKHYTDYQCKKLYSNLAAFSLVSNPLSSVSPVQFQDLHDNLYISLDIFTSECKRIRRKRRFMRFFKRISKGTLVAICIALTIALLAIAIHSVIGILAAPFQIASSAAFLMKKVRHTKKWNGRNGNRRLEAQLDAAAKGFYLLMNDFDTMSRLVMRFNDEVEHSKFVADLCMRKRNNEMLKEVVKELRINQMGIMSHLEELEEHVYLCILNLDRSRRLLMEELVLK